MFLLNDSASSVPAAVVDLDVDPNLSLPALVGPGLGLTGLKALFIGFPSGFTEGDPRTKLEKVLGRPPGLVGLDPNENAGLEDGDGGTLPETMSDKHIQLIKI